MRCADVVRVLLATAALALLAACSGGNSTQTSLILGNGSTVPAGTTVAVDTPTGPNTTEIVVDSGPATGFALGVTNLPFVTLTVCTPGSTTDCVTIDHVLLDTGSIGLRVLRSALGGVVLPPMQTAQGTLTECYPFVVGAVWGPMATADLHIAGESALALPMQIIDDAAAPQAPATADCKAAANGDLLASATQLQAKGVLGVGMLRYDCGLLCEQGNYTGTYTLYYGCSSSGACLPSAVPAEQQVQNPVAAFANDNNGTVIVLPAVPATGAAVARGRLVFGIGTQTNNQLLAATQVLHVDPDPANATYLYLSTTVAGTAYAFSYIDSGSNGLFFDDASLSAHCAGGTWYCPATTQQRAARISDLFGSGADLPLSIANADSLFLTANTAFANLGGTAGNSQAFVWGLPFFFGRPVYTAIWGQRLAVNGPWNAF